MSAQLPEIGKISADIFDEMIYPRLGRPSPHVLVGPQHGVDVGIVEVGGQAVAMTADPVFIVPEYGWERAAWFAIHILASDIVTSGLPPTYLSMDLTLPMEMTKEQLNVVWEVIDRECKQMGMAVVCGHTARYENCHSFRITAGFHGLVYIDRATYGVRRLTLEADGIPRDFPTRSVGITVDYDYVEIGGHDYLMPATGAMLVTRGKGVELNEMEFQNYRKYGADSSIKFDAPKQ